ncbi:MAG: 5'/3'-nucleotidase SurE [Phycisphaerae bacterium]|jgi:5'-nucleotidase
MMRILLSNDDGILAPGLAALYAAVADLGQVSVIAPHSPQSATGHSITLKAPLTVQPVHVKAGGTTFSGLSVDGRPADCVRLAVRSLLGSPVELVLSGINAGANVGINVFYSGTVAAAAEAAMLGLPAVAFSVEMTNGQADFARAARLCRWVLDRLLHRGLTPGQVVNVNIPALGPNLPRGVKVVHQSTAGLEDFYHRTDGDDGTTSYRLGENYSFIAIDEQSDAVCLAEGYITITPLKVDMTDRAGLAALAQETWPPLPR